MTSTLPTNSAKDLVPGFAGGHAARWLRLQEERRFRISQLAELDSEHPAGTRHDNVRAVLRASAAAALSEVEAALDRLERGTYGSCVTCGRALDTERLDVLPMASLCMGCHYNEQNCHVARSLDPDRGR
jgi:DnaK suppressor protein